MQLIIKSDTSTPITFLMVQSSDHVSPLTGATVSVAVSVDGGAFASGSGTVAEIGSGIYKYTPATGDVGTLGPLHLHCTATSGDPTDEKCQVVYALPGNLTVINGDATAPSNLQLSADSIVTGTVASGATTTTIATSSLSPSAVSSGQFQGRIVIFARSTTTAGLRGQATNITASDTSGNLTVSALSVAPVAGDTFVIV